MKAQQIEKLAVEVLDFLVEHKLWVDVRIYFNGKVWDSYDPQTGEFHYNNKGKVHEEKADPKDYFDYVAEPNILSMSFEGAFYNVMNGTSETANKLQQKFQDILSKYGLYYELGNAWNLTCYKDQGEL